MVLTPSNMMPLGTPAPDFSLPDTAGGRTLSRDDCRGAAGLLVVFMCNHCPYVQHIEEGLLAFGRDYRDRGDIGIVAISSNDAEAYPDDSPEEMGRHAREKDYPFPYLYDQSQDVARAYSAACTPDFFLFDASLHCVYRGRFDESRPKSDVPVDGSALRHAMDCVLAGKEVSGDQVSSMGCNIKWKTGA